MAVRSLLVAQPVHEILPPEILICILYYLDVTSISRCSSICVAFRDLIKDSVALQYHIALLLNQYVDGPSSPVIKAERLIKLREHTESWDELKWRKQEVFVFPHTGCSLYELYGGIFGRGNPTNLDLFELPSIVNDAPARLIQHSDLGFRMRDFCMDPNMDLLVLIEDRSIRHTFQLHFRTMSRNTAHPMATQPLFPIPAYEINPDQPTSFVLQIMNDIIGCLAISHTSHHGQPATVSRLLVWNWMKGKLLASLEFPVGHIVTSFNFLSDDHLVIPFLCYDNRPQMSLDVYKFPTDVGASYSPYSGLVHVASYELPIITGDLSNTTFDCRSDPSPSSRSPANSCRPSVFSPSPSGFVICFSVSMFITFADADEGVPEFLIFTHLHTLLDYATRPSASGPGVPTPVRIPYEEWGVEKSRWLRYDLRMFGGFVCYIHGSRVVLSHPLSQQHGPFVQHRFIDVLDFNPYAVARAEATQSHENSRRRVVTNYVDVRDDDFRQDVRAMLPYVRIRKSWKFINASSFMLDNERIIALKHDEISGRLKSLDIYVL